jgi:hypothetical protein
MSLRRKTEIQVADLSDRSTDVVLKHVVQLAAKSRIVTGKKSYIRSPASSILRNIAFAIPSFNTVPVKTPTSPSIFLNGWV